MLLFARLCVPAYNSAVRGGSCLSITANGARCSGPNPGLTRRGRRLLARQCKRTKKTKFLIWICFATKHSVQHRDRNERSSLNASSQNDEMAPINLGRACGYVLGAVIEELLAGTLLQPLPTPGDHFQGYVRQMGRRLEGEDRKVSVV